MGLKANLAIALDPAQLMVKAGLQPDPWQADLLRGRDHRMLLNCCRQSGKTTVIAASAVDEALFHAPSLTMVLGPSERQAKELIRVIDRIRKSLGVAVDPDAQTTTSMEFSSGSRIVAFPAKEQNIRGLAAVSLLIIDEAARVPDDLYNSVRPMLSVSHGRLALLSTPFGKRGFFHKEWSEGEGWKRYRVTGHECARHSVEFLAEEKRTLPDSWFRQEYLCEFADNDGAVFSYDDIQRAVSSEVTALFDTDRQMEGSGVKPLFQ